MNWDALTAMAEITGAAGVIISVVYLAVQVKKQTEEARFTATRELSNQINEVSRDISNDKELAEIYRTAITDYDVLPDTDRLRIGLIFNRFFRCMEQHFIHLSRGNVDPTYVNSINVRMTEILTFPGVQSWWELNKGTHELEFEAYVEEILIEAKKAGYRSSFNSEARDRLASH